MFSVPSNVDRRCAVCPALRSSLQICLPAVPPEFIAFSFNLFDNNSAKIHAKNTNACSLVELPTPLGNVPYSVVATIEHIGDTIQSGHYVAYVKRGEHWLKCNDRTITVADEIQATSQSYVMILRSTG